MGTSLLALAKSIYYAFSIQCSINANKVHSLSLIQEICPYSRDGYCFIEQ